MGNTARTKDIIVWCNAVSTDAKKGNAIIKDIRPQKFLSKILKKFRAYVHKKSDGYDFF